MRMFLLFLVLLGLPDANSQDSLLTVVDQYIDKSVPLISVDSLTNNYDSFTVLDTREREEYEVSHLPKAIYVDFSDFSEVELSSFSLQKPIVVYCSIGYRSEKIGEKLIAQGYEVYNLYGGIFHWVNSGFKCLTTTNVETTKVHPYSDEWGKYLKN